VLGTPARETWLAGRAAVAALFPGRDGVDFAAARLPVGLSGAGEPEPKGGPGLAEILGLGCTHRPVMLRRDQDWTLMLRAALDDPDMPAAMKDPARWPAPLREELGGDWGTAAAGRARAVYRRHFVEARQALDEFAPDVIVMFGDDQYENFREDIVPCFAVLAYEDQDIRPWQGSRSAYNPWGEPADTVFRVRGHQEAGKHLASGLIAAGVDVAYGYRPLHHPFGHAFANTLLLLDDARAGFDYPLIPFSVNCYGRRVNAARGLRLPLALRGRVRELDPPSPSPQRCMAVGAVTARVMKQSPWRTAIIASSSWSHSFLTEKNWQLWPDVAADRKLFDALENGDYAVWHRYTTDEIEDSGQHEVLNWFCLLGAMEELGRRPDRAAFIETWAFVSPVVFAHYLP
jgi:Catalytic LigB subunit of aromatic ring-opening dioxygenase